MKKEQLLLVAAIVVGGLLVWSNTGLYEPVRAADIDDGVTVEARGTEGADPLWKIDPKTPAGRSVVRQTRVEKRLPRPALPMHDALALPWVRPVPWPTIPARLWSALRDPMAAAAKPASAPVEETKEEEDLDPVEREKRDAAAEKEREEKAKRERIAKAAKLVYKSGEEKAVRLVPIGPDENGPVWVILEKWPNVRFLVEELNPDGKTVLGRYPVGPDEIERSYTTVHLEHTLENEYHEQRIRSRVKETDREGNLQLATWVRQNLAPKWGVPAVRLALKNLAIAKALQNDAVVTNAIGDTAQEAFDLDEEIRAYLDYLQGARANETGIIVRLGDAYERAGAHGAAQEQFEKAAKLGDIEGRLRHAQSLLATATAASQLDAAFAEFEKCTANTVRPRALWGMASVRLRQGVLAQAVSLAAEARAADPSSFEAAAVHGAALYATGRFTDAEQAFGAAAVLERAPDRGGGTRGRSNRAMALLAGDKLAEAVKEAEECLQTDALNYLDPLVVLGEVRQRWGDLNASNDAFQTARLRHPGNPWVLLRLAGIRLRDGLPGQALALVHGEGGKPGLLQLVPDAVDALRIAALASAAQETPDWNAAVKYHRRALDKEPNNSDLVFELARALLLGGRADEAIALLTKATEPTSGVAKGDARVLALLAYAQFTAGKSVDDFFALVIRARGHSGSHEATKKYLEEIYKVVDEWNRTRVWEETFGGPPRQNLGGGWLKKDALGIGISTDGEHLAMSGTQKGTAAERKEYTGIWREEELQAMQEVHVTLKAEPNYEVIVHMWPGGAELPPFGGPAGGGNKPGRNRNVSELGFGRDRQGKMKLYVFAANQEMFDVAVKDEAGAERMWPDDGQFHRITFRRIPGDVARGQFEILLDGVKIATPAPIELGQLSAQFSKKANVGVHVDADQGAPVKLFIDAVEVVRMTGQRR